jgi:hypothetical protein
MASSADKTWTHALYFPATGATKFRHPKELNSGAAGASGMPILVTLLHHLEVRAVGEQR